MALWRFRRTGPGPGHVVPKEVSLRWSLSEQTGEGLAYQGKSVCRGMREVLWGSCSY